MRISPRCLTSVGVRKPVWLKIEPPVGEKATKHAQVKASVKQYKLATVCEEAKCPNISECWAGGTATIMLMGDTCTRGCRFCAVKTSKRPSPLNSSEPRNVAETVSKWGLDYIVLTSVDRDDLVDQGAGHIAETIREINKTVPNLLIEALVPDFQGNSDLVEIVANAPLNVFAHNIETTERLSPSVRDRRANYIQSLNVLNHAKHVRKEILTKSSIMLGLGESQVEIEKTLSDLRSVGVDVVTFGQYLPPSKHHMKLVRYVHPTEFDEFKKTAESMGFAYVASGPLVRSSYKAGEYYMKSLLQQN